MLGSSAAGSGSSQREALVAEALEDIITRRLAGEALSDDAVTSSWSHLMPELGERLIELRKVERARRIALHGGGSSVPDAPDFVAPSPPSPELIPGYEIGSESHRGGQGVVYRAVQKSTGRTVAIKIMREGPFAGPRDRARFEREVRILARLNHPNIVAIHDSGVAAGHHYFVMDYVTGRPLDQSLSLQGWSVEKVLTLFADVCDAVNAAHLRGVIHRDLKPANIFIVEEKGAPQPKILDFGLAKVTDDPDGGLRAASMTEAGQFVGSLPWASPEQAEGRTDRVDIRTDVYSLGVVLYQILTGAFPYEVHDKLPEVLHRIVHIAPPRPSVHRRSLDDDVDTIVLKCLAKEPERRYQTAGELARDIRHYLAGDPIDAKRDRGWYVLSRTLRRHRAAVAVGMLFLLLVSGSTIALSLLYRQAQTQAQIAQGASLDARTATDTAERRRAEVERQYVRATRIQEFLEQTLTAATPEEARGRVVDVRDVLTQAAERIDAELDHEPEAEAAIRATIGTAYVSLGEYEAAESFLTSALDIRRRTLPPMHPDTVESLRVLADLLWKTDRSEQGDALLREGLALLEQYPAGDAGAKIALLDGLGSSLRSAGQYAEAETLFRDAIALGGQTVGADDARVRSCHRNLALLLLEQRRLFEAEPIQREVLEHDERILGEDHPITLGTMNNMAGLLQHLGKTDEAVALCRRTIELSRRVRGEDHPDTLVSMNNLGLWLRAQHKLDAAEEVLRRAFELRREKLGPRHADTLTSLASLANILMARGEAEQAEPMLREAAGIAAETMPPTHVYLAVFRNNLGRCLKQMGRYDEAETLLLDSLRRLEETLGAEHDYTRKARADLAELYEACGQLESADHYQVQSDPL